MHNEIGDVVDELAAAAGMAVQLTDVNFTSVAFGPHPRAVDWIRRETLLTRTVSPEIRRYLDNFNVRSAVAPVRIPADPAKQTMARLVVPIRQAGRTVGFLWFLDDGAASQHATLDRITAAAERLGHLLTRDAARWQLIAEKIRDLVGEHEPSRQEALRFVEDHGWFGQLTAVTVAVVAPVEPPPHGLDLAAVTDALNAPRGLDRSVLRVVQDDFVVLLSPAVQPDCAHRATEQALRIVADADGVRSGWIAGMGGTRPTLAGAAEAYRQAHGALRVARAIPEHRPIAEWERLGALRALTMLPAQAIRQAIEPRLAPVLGDAVLAETLRTFLVEAGDVQRTCAALHVHRGTVYYRLRKIEQLSQLSLRNGDDRLTIHTSLHLAALAGKS